MIRERRLLFNSSFKGIFLSKRKHILSFNGFGAISYKGSVIQVKPNESFIMPSNSLVTFFIRSATMGRLECSVFLANEIQGIDDNLFFTRMVDSFIEVKNSKLRNENYILTALGLLFREKLNERKMLSCVVFEKKVYDVVKNDITKKWSLEDVCKLTYTSESTLKRKLKDTGSSLSKIILNVRINHAANLLKKTRLSVEEVSSQSGFSSSSYFCKKFRERYGLSPMQFRRKFTR
ncbi:TPA: AraC family transcriptional regulator [Vibrio vulnificus]|nr:AraC family transcriptional regulator [Vibrio vulnificus]